jgi:hypothetical protein
MAQSRSWAEEFLRHGEGKNVTSFPCRTEHRTLYLEAKRMANIEGRGIFQKDEATFLELINTNFTGLLTKIDADNTAGGTGSTDYLATYGITFPSAYISGLGIRSQGDVLDFLNTFLTNFNLALAHLDADARVQTTTYASGCAITDVIDSSSAGNLYQNGVNQGNKVNLYQTIITNFAALTALLDLDGGLTDTNYAELWNITDTIDNTGCSD